MSDPVPDATSAQPQRDAAAESQPSDVPQSRVRRTRRREEDAGITLDPEAPPSQHLGDTMPPAYDTR